jgi:predicted ferric reductase
MSQRLTSYTIVFIFILPAIMIWVFMEPLSLRISDFSAVLYSAGRLFGLIGMSLFALNFLLISRIKFLDKIFKGLNRVYVSHHLIGAWAFIFLMMHPVALALRFLPVSLNASASFLLSTFTENSYIWGVLGLFSMMVLLILTFYVSLKYHVWKLSHKFLAIAFTFGFIHMTGVSSDVSQNVYLRTYMILIGILAFSAIVYRIIFSEFLVKRHKYYVEETKNLTTSITEIILRPEGLGMKYRAGQFAYFKFKKSKKISREEHPFSIASHPQDGMLKIIVKNLGDYTLKMGEIEKETIVDIEGPFGNFLKDETPNQVWIAGGIGITPFLGKVKLLTPEENVTLFYSVNNVQEAVYTDELKNIAEENPNFKLVLWITQESGRITADNITEFVGEITRDCVINICGPAAMMESLRNQFIEKGVKDENIKSEEFNL